MLLTACGCAAGIALGNWQTGRAAEKRALAAAQEPVTLRGALEPRYTVLLDNKPHRGRPGYHVVQPLRLVGGKYVLINRGWAPAGASRAQLPEVRTPAGEITVTGTRLERFARAYEPAGAKPEGKVWQNVAIEQFAAWSGLALERYVIEQRPAPDGGPQDGLIRDWPRADALVEKNEMYALQWYSLAVLSMVLLLVLNFRREPPEASDPAKRGRVKLALLALFFLLPVGASWLLWWLELVPGATGNYGTLLPPRPAALAPLAGLAPVAALKGKWVLVQFDGGACDAGCERKLYFMRQVRRAQGKEMQRVARLWLLTDSAQPRAELLAAIEGTVLAPAGAGADYPAERSATDHIYLVDPLGNLMMRFPREPDPARVIKDLQRLLRVSRFG